MPNKRRSLGAMPRGSCAVCHQGFADATDEEFKHRFTAHLSSLRHMRYLKLQTTAPVPSGQIILKSKEYLDALFQRARNNPQWPARNT
jgi:hypothetical protein